MLKKEVLEFINTNYHRLQISLKQNPSVSEQTIKNWIERNSPKLTQFSVLEYIKKAYGCIEVNELLEPATVN